MKIRKSYLNSSVLLTKIAAASIAVLVLASCNGGSGKPLSEAKDDPAEIYREYLSGIRKQDNLSIEDLTKHLKQWQTLKDSVFARLRRDSLDRFHADDRMKYERLHDSIRTEFSRLALSKPRTYQEVLTLKEQFSPYAEDRELHQAAEESQPFFTSLDSRPACRGDKQQIHSVYRALLAETLRNGIHNHDDLTAFIEKEDAVFRAFLFHLHDFDNANTADITRATEQCCSQVLLAAERKEMTYPQAMIYLAMRTNRRLIQNATTCIDDIRCKRVKTSAQAHAYIWMLLQPYASLDGFCMALLSPDDRKHLDKIAAQTPAAFEALSKILQSKGDRLDKLPGMLMEIFIHTL